MCCKGRFIKPFAILLLAFGALSFISLGAKEAVNPRNAQFIPCESLRNNRSIRSIVGLGECLPSNDNQISNPMDRIFQLIFILFFISPPLIVILLFMIWRELKARNEK